MKELIREVMEENDDGENDLDVSARVYAETPKGKKIVVHVKNGGYWHIKFIGGGQLPPELSGKFTDYTMAGYSVDAYIQKLKEEEARPKKTRAKSTKTTEK